MKRTGFTLIEMLVAMAIMAILSAATVAAISSVRSSQKLKTSQYTVTHLQQKLDVRVSQMIDKARSKSNPYRPAALRMCSGDPDIADSILCYAYLKLEFPESFFEANQSFAFSPTVSISPPSRYSTIPTFTPLIPGDQAAALLYIALDGDMDAMYVGVDPVTNYHYFKDAYGQPIMFQRWYEPSSGRDSLDPLGKLPTFAALPWLRTQTRCPQVGDNNAKYITILSQTGIRGRE